MTTPILPKKSALAAYTFSPAELNADEEVETWLTNPVGLGGNNYDFVLKLIRAFRDGSSHTYDIDGVDTIVPATGFMYISDATTITTLISYLTGTLYGYLYTVDELTKSRIGDVVTYSYQTATTGYLIESGPNAGKRCIRVSWA